VYICAYTHNGEISELSVSGPITDGHLTSSPAKRNQVSDSQLVMRYCNATTGNLEISESIMSDELEANTVHPD